MQSTTDVITSDNVSILNLFVEILLHKSRKSEQLHIKQDVKTL